MKATVKTVCKTMCLAMAVLLLTVVAAMASPLVGGGDKGGDESLERELEGGIHVTLAGIFRMPWDGEENWIAARFIVEPQQDTQLQAVGDDIFDNDGNRFTYYDSFIGNDRTRSREIIGGVKTWVTLWYQIHKNYGLPLFARATFKFNDKNVVFRNIQTQVPKKP